MQALQLVINRDGGILDAHAVKQNVIGKQHPQRVAIAGIASELSSVTDNENDFSASALTLCKVECCSQHGVVQHVRLFGGRDNHGWPTLNRPAIYHGALRAERASGDGGAVIASGHVFQAIQSSLKLASDCGKILNF